jgi:urease accessory protein
MWSSRGAGRHGGPDLPKELAITVSQLSAILPDAVPRAMGEARLTVRRAEGRTRIATLRLGGSLKLLFPHGAGDPLEAVVLNTAGGLTGGDRMRLSVEAGAGARLVLTSQAAERAYRAAGGQVARVDGRITVGQGARVDWLPQETILYDGAALERRMRVDLADDARFMAVETLVFGRAAMGERVEQLALSDRWEIWRDGRPVLADAVRIDGDAAALMARPGAGGGAGAVAWMCLVAAGAEACLEPLRAALGATGAASLVRPGVVVARAVAEDSFLLRRALVPAIEGMTGAQVPRVWRL